jgi:hypothetical protein
MEKIKYLLDSKAIVFVLVNKFYDIIDYDNAEEYQRSIIDEINIVIEKGQPKGVRI